VKSSSFSMVRPPSGSVQSLGRGGAYQSGKALAGRFAGHALFAVDKPGVSRETPLHRRGEQCVSLQHGGKPSLQCLDADFLVGNFPWPTVRFLGLILLNLTNLTAPGERRWMQAKKPLLAGRFPST
jgi:hypothetical protein